uniref:Uncharacterized protein n=1 Tax=Anguilla anguilla TaxID=7936 RepID=A0A0E9VZD7_ANGAN
MSVSCFCLACSFRAGITNSKPGEPLSAGFDAY